MEITFSKIERLAEFSRKKNLCGDEGFRDQVYDFNSLLTKRFSLEELRQVPEYHKLVGSTQQTKYCELDSRTEITSMIDEFLVDLENQWKTLH